VPSRTQLQSWFRSFGAVECRGRSALYEQLAPVAAESDAILDLCDAAPVARRRPNLLFAAVHFLLLSGDTHPLREYYATVGGERLPDPRASDLFIDFCASRASALSQLLAHRQTQTHEVRRAAVVAAAFASLRGDLIDRPVALVDVGAAAGLNLLLDQYGYRIGNEYLKGAKPNAPLLVSESRGAPVPRLAPRPVSVGQRIGIDTDPLDLDNELEMRWLRACIWPEELERVALLDQAIAFARAEAPLVITGDAVRDLKTCVATLPADLPLCVMHTIALAYLDDGERRSFGETLGEIAVARETYWVGLEALGASPATPLIEPAVRDAHQGDALLSVSRWHGAWQHTLLAFTSMHGNWIDWLPVRGS
jgi:hypothetical protein